LVSAVVVATQPSGGVGYLVAVGPTDSISATVRQKRAIVRNIRAAAIRSAPGYLVAPNDGNGRVLLGAASVAILPRHVGVIVYERTYSLTILFHITITNRVCGYDATHGEGGKQHLESFFHRLSVIQVFRFGCFFAPLPTKRRNPIAKAPVANQQRSLPAE